MVTIYKDVEIDIDNDELVGLVEESTLDVDDVFDESAIADYCNRHMSIQDIFEYDTALAYIASLWRQDDFISNEEKATFLAKIGAQLKEV